MSKNSDNSDSDSDSNSDQENHLKKLHKHSDIVIIVSNNSSVITEKDYKLMVKGCNDYAKIFANIWEIGAPHIVTIKTPLQVPPLDPTKPPILPEHIKNISPNVDLKNKIIWPFYIIDETPEVSGVLGFHTQLGGVVTAFILAKTIINSGGVPLYDKSNPKNSNTVSVTLFHEIAEALMDPYLNTWWQTNNQNNDSNVPTLFYLAEVCDAVENNGVKINVRDHPVMMSDFVTPKWYNMQATTGPYNYTNTLTHPFQIAETGGHLAVAYGQVAFFQIDQVGQISNKPSNKYLKQKKIFNSQFKNTVSQLRPKLKLKLKQKPETPGLKLK